MRPMQLPNRPLLLSTTFAVPAGTVRQPADGYALTPSFDEPLFLDEIRFNFVNKATNTRPENNILVELSMGGSQQLTNLAVPLAALNTSPQPTNFTTGPNVAGSGVIYTPQNGVTFRLPKPMYLNATNYVDKLTPKIHNNTTQPLTVTVSYACRRAAQGIIPEEIWYPYVTAYRTPSFQLDSNTLPFLFESNPSELVNPFSVPLLVDRLVGFIGCDTQIIDNATGGYQNRSYVGELINVRLLDTNGRPVARDLTPFNALFNLQNNAWQARGMLRPHEYYIAQVSYDNNTAANLVVPGIIGTPVTTANVVLIGSRRADSVVADRPLDTLDIPQQPGRPHTPDIVTNIPSILQRKG
jgi:hypothetical protein